MKRVYFYISAVIIYLCFFGVIATAIYVTGRGYPLWFLLIAPGMSMDTRKDKGDNNPTTGKKE